MCYTAHPVCIKPYPIRCLLCPCFQISADNDTLHLARTAHVIIDHSQANLVIMWTVAALLFLIGSAGAAAPGDGRAYIWSDLYQTKTLPTRFHGAVLYSIWNAGPIQVPSLAPSLAAAKSVAAAAPAVARAFGASVVGQSAVCRIPVNGGTLISCASSPSADLPLLN